MPVLWPKGARAACAFTFDLDAETLWMARGVTEPVTLSQGRFGVLDALPALNRGASQQEVSDVLIEELAQALGHDAAEAPVRVPSSQPESRRLPSPTQPR